ncbi:2-methylcitrate dehydratase PrpD [Rhizobium sp. BK529]|uniref:MmgE/PrpD family protein n=1 Tax=Rhizobium sp. BK529 TaxID=2586983 RepID=UPI0016199B49|nr:MmgE/PrpD family protein [Rhizobium sp. BK529]MBB3594810.1 2-methylcitrate dehydratase PrpD [Rhizobium sp. BK529]
MHCLSRVLADHVCQAPAAYPAELNDVARRCILDLVGAAVAGADMPGAVAARAIASSVFGSGTDTIWLTGNSSLAGALFCNSTAATALDIDDGHRAARGHPGAAVIPAALMLTGRAGATGADMLSAVICGYDVGVRIAAGQIGERIGTRQSGRWASFAAAATVGRLLRLEPDCLAHALAIAGVLAPNQLANGSSGYSNMTGNDVKEGIAWSSVLGLTAAHLGGAGFTGPLDILDHSDYYDGGRIVADLGKRWEIADTYFKPYGCCRYIHAALDAYGEIAAADTIDAEDIVEIEVQSFAWVQKLANSLEPQNLVDVQYSLPYCLAIFAIDGGRALSPIDAGTIGRKDLQRLARKVRLSVDQQIDRSFPAQTLARVIVRTRTLQLVSSVHTPIGDPTRPMDWSAIVRKFMTVTRHRLQEEHQQELIDAVAALPDGNPAAIARSLEHVPRSS